MLDFSGHVCGLHHEVTGFRLGGHCDDDVRDISGFNLDIANSDLDNYLRASPTR